MPHIQSRGHCLRAHLIFLYQTELRVKQHLDEALVTDKVSAFEVQLMEDQKRHYDVIYDSAQRLCESLRVNDWLSVLGEEAMKTLHNGLNYPESVPSRLPDDHDLRTIILILTGWLP